MYEYQKDPLYQSCLNEEIEEVHRRAKRLQSGIRKRYSKSI